jgi:hypothetical protein
MKPQSKPGGFAASLSEGLAARARLIAGPLGVGATLWAVFSVVLLRRV